MYVCFMFLNFHLYVRMYVRMYVRPYVGIQYIHIAYIYTCIYVYIHVYMNTYEQTPVKLIDGTYDVRRCTSSSGPTLARVLGGRGTQIKHLPRL